MLYEYCCPKCGVFEDINNGEKFKKCPNCETISRRKFSNFSFKVTHKENLPLGNKARGKFIPPTKDNMGILVPSFGFLEKEEVDYLAEGALEKEKTRVRKSETKEAISKITDYAMKHKEGTRIQAIQKLKGG